MPRLTPFPASTPAPLDRQSVATLAAAEAVLAQLSGRAPLRIESVSVEDGPAVRYALTPDVNAMRVNRGLMEDVVMAALAAPVAATMLELPHLAGTRDPRALLEAALTEPEEREILDAYLAVLMARTRHPRQPAPRLGRDWRGGGGPARTRHAGRPGGPVPHGLRPGHPGNAAELRRGQEKKKDVAA